MVTRLSNHQVLMCLVFVFIAPVLLGKLFLNMHWYSAGATNLGDLLPVKLSYQALKIDNPVPHHWQVLFQVPRQCTWLCKQQISILQRTVIALGKDQNRVKPVLITNNLKQIKHLNAKVLKPNSALATALADDLFVIVDPLGKWVLRYPTVTNERASLLQARHLLTDMKTLLKLSKVG
ncbi:hypothetical protein [Parashewanella tropica]|uniref:hypothetical protein n=1 Tax=Parashewanella tropica TaxID=2547970 RepID=UPI00105994A1|nr:hypothetical protein [Parashewanella tropica]